MPMTEADRNVWAACFARTNYGHSLPTADDMRRLRAAAKSGSALSALVNMTCADLMETDEHYEMFRDEAQSWWMDFEGKELEYIFDTWKGKREVWEASNV